MGVAKSVDNGKSIGILNLEKYQANTILLNEYTWTILRLNDRYKDKVSGKWIIPFRLVKQEEHPKNTKYSSLNNIDTTD